MQNLHICIATGNNISSFIPLMEHMEKGDVSIILASEMVCSNGSAKKFHELLKCYCEKVSLIQLSDEHMLNVPGLYSYLMGCLAPFKTKCENIFIYVNGGQKPSAIALDRAASRTFDGKHHVVYMEFRPSFIIRIYDKEFEKKLSDSFKYQLTIENVLSLYGFEVETGSRVYNNEKWDYELLSDKGYNQTSCLNFFKYKPYYKAIINSFKKGREVDTYYLKKNNAYNIDFTKVQEKGRFFEYCVLWRVKEFLDKKPKYKTLISEVWLNLKIKHPQSDANRTHAEYDILLLLKCGISIHLECKAGVNLYDAKQYRDKKNKNSSVGKDIKHLNSKELKLKGSMSGLSSQYVIMPVDDLDNFEKKLLSYHLFKGNFIKTIPFTIRGQQLEKEIEDNCQKTNVCIKEFEDEFENIFVPLYPYKNQPSV